MVHEERPRFCTPLERRQCAVIRQLDGIPELCREGRLPHRLRTMGIQPRCAQLPMAKYWDRDGSQESGRGEAHDAERPLPWVGGGRNDPDPISDRSFGGELSLVFGQPTPIDGPLLETRSPPLWSEDPGSHRHPVDPVRSRG